MLYDEVLHRLKSKTARDIAAVFTGNLLKALLSFLSNLIAIRGLGPAAYGIVASANAVMTLTSQAADFGLSTSSVRYGSRYLEDQTGRTRFIFKVTFLLKLSFGIPLVMLLIYLSPSIAAHVFGKTQLTVPLMIAFGGSMCFLMAAVPLGILQTYRRFRSYMIVAVLQGVVQLSLVALREHPHPAKGLFYSKASIHL